jgi:hypothetical protein
MKGLLRKVAPYSKFIVSLGGAVVVTGQVVADGSVTGDEAMLVVTAFATAVGVYFKRNPLP